MIETLNGLRSLILNGRQAMSNVVMQGTWTAIGTVTLPAVTLGGTVTLNGQVFDAGAGEAEITNTAGALGLTITSVNDSNRGPRLDLVHDSASIAVNDITAVRFLANDFAEVEAIYGSIAVGLTNVGDGTEAAALTWTLMNAGAGNDAMTLSGVGVLSPDHSIMFAASQDSGLVADQVSLGGYEIAAGQRSLAISQENPVVNAAAGASDNYLPIRVNGATFKLLLHS